MKKPYTPKPETTPYLEALHWLTCLVFHGEDPRKSMTFHPQSDAFGAYNRLTDYNRDELCLFLIYGQCLCNQRRLITALKRFEKELARELEFSIELECSADLILYLDRAHSLAHERLAASLIRVRAQPSNLRYLPRRAIVDRLSNRGL